MPTAADLGALSDRELVEALDAAAVGERETLCLLLKYLVEVESRGLYREMGYRTVFDYCVLRLKMSEGAAMRRIYSARAASKIPELYERLRSGALSLSSVSRLAPHLKPENARDLIARASGARLREVETLIAELTCIEARPVPESAALAAQSELTFDPAPRASASESVVCSVPATPLAEPVILVAASRKRDSIRLEAPGVLRFVFRASPAFREKLEVAARLLGRRPDGRLETLVELVVDRFLEKEDPFRRKIIPARSSKRRVRRVSRSVRDEVWRRDNGRCAFTAPDGVRCAALTKLEYDHIKPWARGGASDDPANIRLLCRAHNLHLARKDFGARVPKTRVDQRVSSVRHSSKISRPLSTS